MNQCIVAIFLCLASGVSAKSVTPFAENIFGVWHLKKGVPTKAILGPLAYDFLSFGPGLMRAGLTALRDEKTGDVWFTLLDGQQWRTTGNQTQYCFGEEMLLEQSPFQVNQVTDTSVHICWRDGDRGMPTHTKGCKGCDCARILLNLTDPDTLTFTFWMSPPVIHADFTFTRAGRPPTMRQAIHSTSLFPYQQCGMRDHYGPNIPGEPDLRNKTYTKTEMTLPGGCGTIPRKIAQAMMKSDDIDFGFGDMSAEMHEDKKKGQCHQLNGINLGFDALAKKTNPSVVMNVSDVKIQFVPPSGKCEPCDVSYSVSAKIEEDEYIGVGFKGQSWEAQNPYPPVASRPCYFGMCVDSYDNFTSDRMIIGYTASGGCVREMTTNQLIGAPVDADYKIVKSTSVERSGDRTILRFTVSQHWPKKKLFKLLHDGFFRVMWAIGKVSSDNGCVSDLGYHFNHRGVAPIDWLFAFGSTPCKYNPDEMGESVAHVLV